MKFLPFFLLLCLPTLAQKASKDTLIRYFDASLEPCKKKQYVFIGVIIREVNGWSCAVYDDSTRIIMRGKYRDEDCTIKDGWFMHYYSNGRRSIGGKFENNARQGYWLRWYETGQIRDSLLFLNQFPEGPSYSWFYNGQLESSGFYHLGKYSDNWIFYHENGKMATREKYEEAKLADIECFDSMGNSMGINCAVLRNPEIIGKYGGIIKYLQDSIVFPLEAYKNDISGVVNIEFTVSKDGTMKDLKIISSPDAIFTKEVIRVLNSVPGWYPAISHNRRMDFTFKMSVPFFKEQGVVTGTWNESWYGEER